MSMKAYTGTDWDIVDKFENKGYQFYNFHAYEAEAFAKEFIDWVNTHKDQKWYSVFNSHYFCSDDDLTVDNIFKSITGKTVKEWKQKEKEELEQIEKEQIEYQESIPTLTEQYIEKGHNIIDEKYWEDWDKCVHVRLDDLYRGYDLDCCLELMEMINKKEDFNKIKKIFDEDQGHSGFSHGLVKSMVNYFGGSEFVNFLNKEER